MPVFTSCFVLTIASWARPPIGCLHTGIAGLDRLLRGLSSKEDACLALISLLYNSRGQKCDPSPTESKAYVCSATALPTAIRRLEVMGSVRPLFSWHDQCSASRPLGCTAELVRSHTWQEPYPSALFPGGREDAIYTHTMASLVGSVQRTSGAAPWSTSGTCGRWLFLQSTIILANGDAGDRASVGGCALYARPRSGFSDPSGATAARTPTSPAAEMFRRSFGGNVANELSYCINPI